MLGRPATLGVRPDDALVTLTAAARSPLTVDEGVVLITQFPQALEKNLRAAADAALVRSCICSAGRAQQRSEPRRLTQGGQRGRQSRSEAGRLLATGDERVRKRWCRGGDRDVGRSPT